ncbi:hypothetical protein SDC9_41692 [bioreactor metagenome]|uniref:Uncharacterized protein n=1 Tax=bioreactor metagenome TaxID=1076179 RepID=A0A644VVU6_9ZZZZ
MFLSSEVCGHIHYFSPFLDSTVPFLFSAPFFSQRLPVFFGNCPYRLLEFLSHGAGDPHGDVSEPAVLSLGAPGEKVRLVSGAVAAHRDSLHFLRQAFKDPFQFLLLLPAGRNVSVAVPASRHKVVFGAVGVQGLVALLSLVVPVGSALFRLDERGVLVEGDVLPGRVCRREGEEAGEHCPQSLEVSVLFGDEGFPHPALPVLVPVVEFIEPLSQGARRGNRNAELLKGQFLLQEGEVVRCASSREMEKDKGKDMFTVTESP